MIVEFNLKLKIIAQSLMKNLKDNTVSDGY